MSSSLPKPFGKYLLIRRLAVGGMAEIYLAKARGAEGFQRDVVIKQILPSYSEDEAFVTMFIDEARIAARLHHVNIVQIYDFDKFEDSYYIAMEYVEGRDLRKVMDRAPGRKIPPLKAVYIAAEVAAGLRYAHTRKGEDGQPLDIVHRDVSPHNILISFGGEVKITDFGIAKAAARSTKTRAGTVKGKCAYMSPEQARGKPLDGRSDLFAVAAILWEMLTGRRAFDGDSDFEILNNVLNQNVPPPSLFAPIARELDAIVLKGLRKERDERYPDMASFEKDLRDYIFKHASSVDDVALAPMMAELFAEEIKAEGEAEILAAKTPSSVVSARTPSAQPAVSRTGEKGTLVITDDERPQARLAHADEATVAVESALPTTVPVGMLKQELEQLLEARAGQGRAITSTGARAARTSSPAIRASSGVLEERPALEQVSEQPTVALHGEEAEELRARLAVGEPAVLTGRFKQGTPAAGQKAGGKRGVLFVVLGLMVVVAVGIAAYSLRPSGPVEPPATPVVTAPPPEEPVVTKDTGPVASAPDVAQEIKPVTATVEFRVTPANATVKVDGSVVPLEGGQRVIAKRYKIGDELSLSVSAPGYREYSAKVTINEPNEVVTVKLEAAARPVAETGFVTINARPWADVYFKGRKVGTTPVRRLEVPTGRQTFTLKNATTTKTVTLVVEKGKDAVSPVIDM